MKDAKVKCSRCRNIHLMSERERKQDKKYKDLLLFDSVCPRCGCKTYYELNKAK